MIELSEEDRQLIVGAIDSLGTALATHHHQWTIGEREIYEQAMQALGVREAIDFEDKP